MLGVQNVSSVPFQGNYLIPFNQIKDSATMRAIGAETSKYADIRDMAQNQDGIVVKVDDTKAKEYEAVIAKYGVNIKKYDGDVDFKSDTELKTYEFMVSKLYPDEVQQRVEAYKNMDEAQKSKEYINIYKEFKNSKFSIEKQSGMSSPKMTPTEKPIIKFTTKSGENMMAREVQLENGYRCMVVANENNPNQGILVNKDEFQKLFLESVKQI